MKKILLSTLIAITSFLQLNSIAETLIAKHHNIELTMTERGSSNGGTGIGPK